MNVSLTTGFAGTFALVPLLAYGALLPKEPDSAQDPLSAQAEIPTSAQESQFRAISLLVEKGSPEHGPQQQATEDHFLLGENVWSAATNQAIRRVEWQGATRGEPWPIRGTPDRYFLLQAPYAGFVRTSPVVVAAGSRPTFGPTMEVRLPVTNAIRQSRVQPPAGFPGPFLNQDLRRVVYFRDGDVWRAEVDWSANRFTSHQQVTRVGLLNAVRSGDIVPLAWHENTLLVRANLSRERPILRVDLGSGSIDELETMMVFERDMFSNPSGSRVCGPHTELLACYELASGETYRLQLARPVSPRLFSVLEGSRFEQHSRLALWADDETLLVATPMGSRPQRTYVLRIDFRDRRSEVLFSADGLGTLELLPGGRHVAVSIPGGDGVPGSAARIGIGDGASVPLPEDAELDGAWLDEDRYLFARTSGGIGEIGTWLHDLARGETRRICALPASLTRAGADPALLFPRHNAVYFNTGAGGGGVFRADLATGECERVAEQTAPLWRFRTPPVDLRPGVSGDALWTSGPSAPQAGGQAGGAVAGAAQPAPAAPPTEQPQGLERLLQDTEGLPPELGEEVVQVYRRAQEWPPLRDYFHPDCYALAFLEWRQETPHLHRSRFEREHERFAHCVDGARIAHISTDRVQRMLSGQYPEDQVNRIAGCAGETMAEKFAAAPVPTTRNRSSLFSESIQVCRRRHAP